MNDEEIALNVAKQRLAQHIDKHHCAAGCKPAARLFETVIRLGAAVAEEKEQVVQGV
jgi:hypothetical protein